jgi:hypothetical protein
VSKVVEIMLIEAMVLADPFFLIPGSDGKR